MPHDSHIENAYSIDFEFISQLEDDISMVAYVPIPVSDTTGVKVAPNVDLSALSEADLRKFCLNPTLIGKLYPYIGLRGQEAFSYLNDFPLELSVNELEAINEGRKRQLVNRLADIFDSTSPVPFASIPACWQTVVLSVESQYGDIQKKCPSFWCWVVNQKWDKAIGELRDFGDQQSARRNLEADYIESLS